MTSTPDKRTVYIETRSLKQNTGDSSNVYAVVTDHQTIAITARLADAVSIAEAEVEMFGGSIIYDYLKESLKP